MTEKLAYGGQRKDLLTLEAVLAKTANRSYPADLFDFYMGFDRFDEVREY